MRRALLVLSIVLMASGLMGLILGSSRTTGVKNEPSEPSLSTDNEAEKVVEQFIGLGEAGIPLLVEALNSPRTVLAQKAKQVLLEDLDAWRWPATAESSKRFMGLAAALGGQTPHFAPEGRAAALDLATRMMSWPLDERFVDRREVLGYCEKVVIKTPAKADASIATTAHRTPADSRPSVAAPLRSLVKDDLPAQPAAEKPKVAVLAKPAAKLAQPASIVQSIAGSPAQTPPAASPRPPQAQPNSAVSLVSATGSTGGTAASIPTTVGSLPPQAFAGNGRPAAEYAGIDSWELLGQLIQADSATQGRLRAELTARGFSDRDVAVGIELQQPDVETRKRLVESLTGMAGVDPLRWLWQAARDSHPDVRLTALSLLATSRDPQMVEQVLRAAGGDGDPRIQRLAQQIETWRTTPR